MSHIASLVNPLPWLVIGDFHVILNKDDRRAGSLDWPPVMNEFSDCVTNSELVDLRYNGCRFTWMNGQEGGASTEFDLLEE